MSTTFMDNLYQDLRYALRVLRRSPGFTVISVLTLALGIGGITTMFSVVNGVILHPLPYGNADRLVRIAETRKLPFTPPPKGADWQDRSTVFDGLVDFAYAPFTFTDGSDAPLILGAYVPSNYLSVLQAKPYIGRNFTVEDGLEAAPSVAIVTYGFWQGRLGADANILGKALKFAEATVTVVGVMPPSFRAPVFTDAQIFTPVSRVQLPGAGLVGRLKPGITAAQAESAVNALIKEIDTQFHAADLVNRSVQLQPLLPVDATNKALLLLLFGSVGFILLMAIINVANLMLSRTVGRDREIAVRCAIGASRFRLIRLVLTESLLLAVLGGVLGLLLGYAGTQLLVSWMPQSFPRVHEIYIDTTVAAFAFVTTLLASIGFGISPALAFSRPNLQDSLKDGSHQTSEPRRSRRLRHSLVAVEIGLAVVLLIGAALVGTTFWNLITVPLGFETHNVVLARLNVFPRYRGAAGAAFRSDLIERMKQNAQVDSASMTSRAPVATGVSKTGFWLEGQAQSENATVIDTQVTSDYFRSLQVGFLKGRTFEDGSQNAVVNQALANAYWPNADPIGKQFRLGLEGNPGPWLTIVGVTPSERVQLNKTPTPQVFRSCGVCGILLVRTRGTSAGIGALIRREVAAIDSSLVITILEPLDSLAAQNSLILDSQFRMALFLAFAGAGLLLACAGVYGVTSYTAAQRTQEIGIRMALGANRREVLRMIIGQSTLPICIGLTGGVAAALALTHLLESYLFGVTPRDANVFVIVPVFLALVAMAANLVPALRSTRIDPLSALKYE